MSPKGPSTDLAARKSNFRSTPESGLKSDVALGPVRAAMSGHFNSRCVTSRYCRAWLNPHPHGGAAPPDDGKRKTTSAWRAQVDAAELSDISSPNRHKRSSRATG